MRRLFTFLLMVYSVLSFLLMAAPANAQDWRHSRSEIHVAPPMHLHIGVEPPRMIFERENYNSRGYGQPYGYRDQYNPMYNDYDSYNDRYYSGSQLPHGPIVTGGIAGALIGGALGRGRGALLGGGVGMLGGAIIQDRNNRRDAREYARPIVYAQPLSQREYVPYREEVRDPTVLMINATQWPVMVINRSNNTNAILAAGQSAQMDDGDITGLVDMRGKYHQACVQRTLTGWTFTFPDVHP